MTIFKLLLGLVTGKTSPLFLKAIVSLLNVQAQQLIAKILPQAVDVVVQLASNNELTNKQKQKQAFDKIAKISKEEGLKTTDSIINLVIEIAVAKLKNN